MSVWCRHVKKAVDGELSTAVTGTGAAALTEAMLPHSQHRTFFIFYFFISLSMLTKTGCNLINFFQRHHRNLTARSDLPQTKHLAAFGFSKQPKIIVFSYSIEWPPPDTGGVPCIRPMEVCPLASFSFRPHTKNHTPSIFFPAPSSKLCQNWLHH